MSEPSEPLPETVSTSQILAAIYYEEFGRDPESSDPAALMAEIVETRVQRDLDRSRVGIAFIGEQELLQYFNAPPGYEVVAVNASFERMGIVVMLRHRSLPPIAPGAHAPLLPGAWAAETHVCYDEHGEARHMHAERVWSADVEADTDQEQDQQDHQDGDQEVQPTGPRAHADHLRPQGARPRPGLDTDHTLGS